MTKLYTEKQKVSYEMAAHVSDEKIKKDLAHSIIKNMNLDDLSKLFRFKVVNPISNESQRLLENPTTPSYIKEHIMLNRESLTLEYEASIFVFDKHK